MRKDYEIEPFKLILIELTGNLQNFYNFSKNENKISLNTSYGNPMLTCL